jgi:prepilin-type N-terminal cleavage/methylation domain-containing protein
MNTRISGKHPRVAKPHGFTLLEMCIVLFIIALLAGAAMPAMRTAFLEQQLRGDSHQLALMVRTAMITSSEQGRPYIIALDGKNVTLAPAAASIAEAAPPASQNTDDPDKSEAGPGDVTQAIALSNVLQFPDAEKKNKWETLPSVSWTLEPNGLCPLPRVRLARGDAYVEMSFNALTGDVEDEALSIP